jgi:hypothetical protein
MGNGRKYVRLHVLQNSEWKRYRLSVIWEMRPYVPGEPLDGISVSKTDTPEEGGMIARDMENHNDQWYVAKAFFEKNCRLWWR